jgi:F-type H+-transporting ATPase subunit b
VNITATLIGQSVTFLLFVLFCMKYVWPAILNLMEAREKRIEEGLESAERAGKDLELAKQKVSQQLKEAKEQASAIVEQANKRAVQIIEEAKEQAQVEGQRIKDSAQAELDREIARAREQLRRQVAVLALAGAEKVLGQTIDISAHNAMLDKLAAQL